MFLSTNKTFPRIPATAIVLAGGRSTRMGQDKRLLPIQGEPLIQRVCGQVSRRFNEVLIAANDPARLAFLNLPVIPDETPGQGPLGGIISAMAMSRHDINFIVACDIPFIDFVFVAGLLREAGRPGCDGAVPVTSQGRYEPVFAVYRKSMLPAMRDTFARGQRKITDVFRHANVCPLALPDAVGPKDLNTMDDYHSVLDTMLPQAGAAIGNGLGSVYVESVENVEDGLRVMPRMGSARMPGGPWRDMSTGRRNHERRPAGQDSAGRELALYPRRATEVSEPMKECGADCQSA